MLKQGFGHAIHTVNSYDACESSCDSTRSMEIRQELAVRSRARVFV